MKRLVYNVSGIDAQPREVSGYQPETPGLAVRNVPEVGKWLVDHLASGWNVGPTFKLRKQAETFANLLGAGDVDWTQGRTVIQTPEVGAFVEETFWVTGNLEVAS